jgi:signal transduction histidine kinase
VSLSRAELDAWIADPTRQVTITALYDHTDGVECSWINSYYTPYAAFSGGRLYFTTRTGVGVLDPRRIHFNHVVPPVVIEQVTADGVTHDAASMPELPPLVRDLRIDYTALSLTAPRKVRFRYKLEGSDEGWQEAGTRRQAFYSDLAPGSYRFRVTACNDDGVWNEEDATLAFRVLPTFYQTKAFLLLSIAVGACAVWGTYHWRMRRVAARLAAQFDERLVERTRIAQELHDTLLQGFLGASMQLHLAVDRLPTDSPERSRMNHVLALMARVIDEGRNAVRGLRTPAAPGGDLEQAFSAIPGELELPEGVGFRVVGEGTARSLHAVVRDEVYRIGREAILNAFRHSDASSIEVEIAFARDQLCVRVRDDGRGIAPEVLDAGREGHFGLSGMRERAERIGGKLSLRSRVGDGTEVELVVPGRLVFTETE